MKIAWNEITYQPKKFVLIEFLIATLMFMVVFLSGLTNGLAASVSAPAGAAIRRASRSRPPVRGGTAATGPTRLGTGGGAGVSGVSGVSRA